MPVGFYSFKFPRKHPRSVLMTGKTLKNAFLYALFSYMKTVRITKTHFFWLVSVGHGLSLCHMFCRPAINNECGFRMKAQCENV